MSKFTSHLVDDLRSSLKTLTTKAERETTDAGKKLLLTVGAPALWELSCQLCCIRPGDWDHA